MTTNVDVTRESDDYRQGYLALSHRIERFNRRICMERKKKKKKEGGDFVRSRIYFPEEGTLKARHRV